MSVEPDVFRTRLCSAGVLIGANTGGDVLTSVENICLFFVAVNEAGNCLEVS